MEEPTPNPTGSPEHAPLTPLVPELSGEEPQQKPERGAAPQERIGGREAGNQNQGMTLPKAMPPMQIPVSAPPSTPAHAQTTSDDDDSNPMIADDVDLIEKEWVEKAKSIVDSTRNDPHAQEKEVSKLQADYLKKRYGRDVKVSS